MCSNSTKPGGQGKCNEGWSFDSIQLEYKYAQKPIHVVAPTPLAMSVEEPAEYNSILHRKAADKLHRVTNGEPL